MAIKCTVEIDENLLQNITDSIIDDELMTEAHQILYEMCDPYVPYLTGALSENVSITSECVEYHQPYAAEQYEGVEFRHSTEYHPLATSYWDVAMMRDHGDEFYAKMEELVIRKAKEKYG